MTDRPFPRRTDRRERAWGQATTLLFMYLALSPNMGPVLLPVLDGSGLEILLTVLGLQVFGIQRHIVMPWLTVARDRVTCLLAGFSGLAALPWLPTWWRQSSWRCLSV